MTPAGAVSETVNTMFMVVSEFAAMAEVLDSVMVPYVDGSVEVMLGVTAVL